MTWPPLWRYKDATETHVLVELHGTASYKSALLEMHKVRRVNEASKKVYGGSASAANDSDTSRYHAFGLLPLPSKQ